MPDSALASIPEPVFFAISDNTGDPGSQRILKERKFTMVVDKDDGELQLGCAASAPDRTPRKWPQHAAGETLRPGVHARAACAAAAHPEYPAEARGW